jgi:hypothetical protein
MDPEGPKNHLEEHFQDAFSLSQIRFAQWLISDGHATNPNVYDTPRIKNSETKTIKSVFGCIGHDSGHVNHRKLNALLIGSGIAKECMKHPLKVIKRIHKNHMLFKKIYE